MNHIERDRGGRSVAGTKTGAFTLDDLRDLAGSRPGYRDVPCPVCGPDRRDPANRVRPVLRVWLVDDRFGTFFCARCGVKGEAFAEGSGYRRIDRPVFRQARAASEARERIEIADRQEVARALWRRRLPLPGTIAEHYLRNVRGYRGAIPDTLGFLRPRDTHPPAMIAAFGLPDEPEPGRLVLHDAAVQGVHITRLASDGGGKAGDPAKVIIGRCLSAPIVLSAMNDSLGLAVTEGIEDGLSIFESTGLGVWVAGAAGRMPALATTIPRYADTVSIIADGDAAGQRAAHDLAVRLRDRSIDAEIINLDDSRRMAA